MRARVGQITIKDQGKRIGNFHTWENNKRSYQNIHRSNKRKLSFFLEQKVLLHHSLIRTVKHYVWILDRKNKSYYSEWF